MKRREFKQVLLAAILGQAGLSASQSCVAASRLELDRFGGWKEKSFEATDFFRTEHDGQRWWLVTPEGSAFLSFGINHLHSDIWQQDFNRETWQAEFGIEDIKDWPKFMPALRKWFLATCEDYGFNTAGVHTSLNVLNRPKPAIAYMRPIKFVDIPHWKSDIPDTNFLDVFAPDFASRCDAMAKESVAPEDPFLLGYTMTDCPLLTEEDCRERPDVIGGARRESRIGWPRRLRNLGADAEGKLAYVETVRDLYLDQIDGFNRTYGTKFATFAELASAVNWRPDTDLSNANETRDNVVFLQRVVDKYYSTARDAIRRYDPNHMFIGDKLNGNTDTMDTVLPITSKYTDVVMYQMYARYEVQQPGLDRWSKIANQPLINGDAAFTMIAPFMPRPFGPIADSLQQRVEWTVEFFLKAFARPEFVGWHYCGLLDATQQIGRKQARQHSGLMNAQGEAYPELKKAIQECSASMYEIATGKA
ncbi:MAG: hypothetical protein AAF483_23070 [Planctomycetota bacterium]